MLKIVLMETRSQAATLTLEGLVIGPWVEELERSCESVLSTGAELTLDFSAVSFIDRGGVELFRSLRSRRVEFLNCSPFVAEQLGAVGQGSWRA